MQGWALSPASCVVRSPAGGLPPRGSAHQSFLHPSPNYNYGAPAASAAPQLPSTWPFCPRGAPVSGSPLSHGREDSIFEPSALSGGDCLEGSKGGREGGDRPVAVMGAVQVQPQRRCSSSSFIPSGIRSPSLAQDCGGTGRVKGRGKRGRKGVFQVRLLCPPSQILRSV